MDYVDVTEIEASDRDHGVDPPKHAAGRDADYVDTSSFESLLIVGRDICAPDRHLVPPAHQFPTDLLYVLIATSYVGPVPDVNQQDVQRAMRFHQSPTMLLV